MQRLREWVRRLLGALRQGHGDRDLEEELRLHLELAEDEAQRQGLTAHEARRAARIRAGGMSQAMDALRDQRGLPWLDALASDIVFASRQLRKHRTATAAAIISLGLAVGATTAAFRLVDAMLLRPLPVADPERLFGLAWNSLTPQGALEYRNNFDYPTFRRYSTAVGQHAEMLLIGLNSRQEVTIGNSATGEPIYRQYLSGNVFTALGLTPALGRLLLPGDDAQPGVAVIGFDFWTTRFARDPHVIGQRMRIGRNVFEIIGVAPTGFTGTEPGQITDVFLPAGVNYPEAIKNGGWVWFQIWVRANPGTSADQLRQVLQIQVARDRAAQAGFLPHDTPRERVEALLNEQILVVPASAGLSSAQRSLRRPLLIVGALVLLVLLIACANVANLLGARAIARTREMALRASIGAGRRRLIQLVLVESAMLAILASAFGAVFAWWATPVVIALLAPPEDPVRLVLDANWRVLAFGVTVTTATTFLFGLTPALRASAVTPAGALNTRTNSHDHRRLTRVLVRAQMGFCVFVLFVAGLLVASFSRMSNHPLGFSKEQLLVLEIETRGNTLSRNMWAQVVDSTRSMPGVSSASLAAWAPLTGNRWIGSVHASSGLSGVLPPYFLEVFPAYFDTMRIRMVAGRDFRPEDAPPGVDERGRPVRGTAIVNQAFANAYLGGSNPVGSVVNVPSTDIVLSVSGTKGIEVPIEIVGLVGDAVYWNVREAASPTLYLPIADKRNGALVVRTAGDPMALAPTLRREVPRVRPELRVSNAVTQSALVRRQLVRERLLALLSLFFAGVALVLAATGLYGVLNYAVTLRQREIGVRMALGARAAHVVNRVVIEMLRPVGVGSLIGLAAGSGFGRLIEGMLFEVKTTDLSALLTPIATLLAAAALAALPPAMRAVRIDPAQTLRSE